MKLYLELRIVMSGWLTIHNAWLLVMLNPNFIKFTRILWLCTAKSGHICCNFFRTKQYDVGFYFGSNFTISKASGFWIRNYLHLRNPLASRRMSSQTTLRKYCEQTLIQSFNYYLASSQFIYLKYLQIVRALLYWVNL